MEQELLILENKLEQLLAYAVRLREENVQLAARVVAVEAEKSQLQGKMETAKAWVEQLIARIGDEPEEGGEVSAVDEVE